MKKKSILLTTLGEQPERLLKNHQYFYYDDGKHTTYCDTLIVPEAGAKYILSKELIDEIIVLGNGASCLPEEENRPLPLGQEEDYDVQDLEKISEYGFFRYRMSQFVEEMDIDGLDVMQSIDSERDNKLTEYFGEIKKKLKSEFPDRYIPGAEFHLLNQEPEIFNELKSKTLSEEDLNYLYWLRHEVYLRMDSSRKMHPLDRNRNVPVYFIPTEKGSSDKLSNIAAIIAAIKGDEEEDVDLYMDMQGIDKADSFTLITLLQLLNDDTHSHLHIRQLITTHQDLNRLATPISNEFKYYNTNQLTSGVKVFIEYGKVDLILDYWKSTGLSNPLIERTLYGMRCVDDGISLCHIGCLVEGIQVLQEVFSGKNVSFQHQRENDIFYILSNTIRNDYGELLDMELTNELALLEWCFRKRFYQQAMTIIESRIPSMIVQKGILFYAKDPQSKELMLEDMQKKYVDTDPLQRWQFNDPDHYFIKYYALSKVNFRKSPEERAVEYANLLVDILDPEKAAKNEMVTVYSLISEEQNALKNLLRTYYLIGPLRNKINHAEEERGIPDFLPEAKDENPIMTQVKNTISEFLEAYKLVLEKLGTRDSSIVTTISGEEFKEYSIAHKEETRKSRNR